MLRLTFFLICFKVDRIFRCWDQNLLWLMYFWLLKCGKSFFRLRFLSLNNLIFIYWSDRKNFNLFSLKVYYRFYSEICLDNRSFLFQSQLFSKTFFIKSQNIDISPHNIYYQNGSIVTPLHILNHCLAFRYSIAYKNRCRRCLITYSPNTNNSFTVS